MKFKIELVDEHDLETEDAYLSYGWLVLESRGLQLNLFKDKSCMIFLTSTALLAGCCDMLSGKRKYFDWVADGYGASLRIQSTGKSIELSGFEMCNIFASGNFYRALADSFELIISDLIDSGGYELDKRFIDLRKYTTKLGQLIK